MQRCFIFFIAGLFSLIFGLLGNTYADNRQILSEIHQSIDKQEKKIARQRQEHHVLTAELQRQETAMAILLASIQQMQVEIGKLNNEINQLNQQIQTLQEKYAKQQKMLATQLEMAFKLGRNSGLELFFNNKDSERNERIIAYFGYINRVRQEQIYQLKLTHDALAKIRQTLENRRTEQQSLQLRQKKEQTQLKKNRSERQKTLASLDASMQEGQQKLAQLYDNEEKLQAKLAQAARISKTISDREAREADQIRSRQTTLNYKPTLAEKALMSRVSGIGMPQHALDWPLPGNIRHYFGQTIQGQLYWKGLVIGGQEGSQVRAIADGRVILANWLQGYGFMVVIDHGRGDMSLYGYNQRVLVNVEDKIKKGQAIALVGNSGGQGSAGLYFEIRRDGQALNPQAWLK